MTEPNKGPSKGEPEAGLPEWLRLQLAIVGYTVHKITKPNKSGEGATEDSLLQVPLEKPTEELVQKKLTELRDKVSSMLKHSSENPISNDEATSFLRMIECGLNARKQLEDRLEWINAYHRLGTESLHLVIKNLWRNNVLSMYLKGFNDVTKGLPDLDVSSTDLSGLT